MKYKISRVVVVLKACQYHCHLRNSNDKQSLFNQLNQNSSILGSGGMKFAKSRTFAEHNTSCPYKYCSCQPPYPNIAVASCVIKEMHSIRHTHPLQIVEFMVLLLPPTIDHPIFMSSSTSSLSLSCKLCYRR